MYEDDEFSHQMPSKKDYVSIAKGVHKQERLVLCNLREMYAAFKEKYPNVKLGFFKFYTFRQNGVYLLGLQALILYVYAVSIKMQFYWLMQSTGISHTKI